MSIALDLALYLREQKSLKPLTLSEKGALFTLFFRVGSNPFSWVSQEILAIELDVDERHVKRLLKSIANKGYIDVEKNPKDKRKNLYRPAEFLINYHQQANRKETKEYKKKGTSLSPKLRDRGHNCHLNRGHNCHLSKSENNTHVVENKKEKTRYSAPKVKEEIKKSKVKGEKGANRAITLPDYFYPNEEAKKIAKEKGLSLRELLNSFRNWANENGVKSKNWDKAFLTWVETEKNVKKKAVHPENEIRCTVPWFNPDHARV